MIGRRELRLVALIAILLVVVGLINPVFLSIANVRDILVRAAPLLIIACGMTFVVLIGEIDISVGSLMGFLAAVLGTITSSDHLHLPTAVGIAAIMLIGMAIGSVNGLLVTVGKVPSIIVTLGMLTLLTGATQIVMAGHWITNLPRTLRYFGVGSILGLPVCIVIATMVFVVCAFIARQTPYGLRIYASGDNPGAAKTFGLKVNWLRWSVFALTGLLTAVATLVSAPQLSVIESGFGQGSELTVVTAVVVGGTSIRGGKGTILGTFLAVLLICMIRPILTFLRLGESATYWEKAIQGSLILGAVLLDQLGRPRGKAAIA